jgi:phosphate transport system substrate-binding protein
MKFGLKSFGAAVAALAMTGAVNTASAGKSVTGAGATFPAPIYQKWAAVYKGASGVSINYNSIGSGGGIQQIKAGTVTFGASDKPLKAADLDASDLAQFPTVIGGDVPVVNINGVGPGQLVLDGPTLAKIFLGQIGNWSDPAIAALNPGVHLPNQAIAVVHRSDGSGTTFIWANYLSKVSPEWASRVGADTAVDWPVGIGARGNEGVSQNVAQTGGAIGYVEYAYAKVNNLAYTRMINSSGATVSPNLASFEVAAAGTDWSQPGFYAVVTNAAGQASWPIAGATFILVHKHPSDPGATAEALKFFQWAFAKGDDYARALDYVPLPDDLVSKIEGSWSAVQGSH